MKRFTATMLTTALAMFAFAATGLAQTDTAAMIDAYAQVWNTGNLGTLDGLVEPSFVRHTSPGNPYSAANLDSLKRVITNLRATYPDFKVTLTEVIATNDKVVARWQWSGTHAGVGLPAAKGKKVQATGINIMHVKNGKFVEEWVESDGMMTAMQLGFTVTPPAK